MKSEEKIIQERKEKVLGFFKKNPNWIFYCVLIILLILGLYLRYLPLGDHGGRPGLWDETLNDYSLGPDLDPYLFLRYAKAMITTEGLPQIDNMRYVPLGFDTSRELQMVSYSIVLTYKILNIFGEYSINYAGAFMPVWIFGLTILAFFFFVKEIFKRKIENVEEQKINLLKANIIASISTLFMIIMPAFLSRTIAGIPEKESVAFFFMFLAFYLFLKAWKTEKISKSAIYGILAGITTGLMGLTWGGVTYIYVTLGLAGFVAFVLNKFQIRQTIVYGLWWLSSIGVIFSITNKFNLISFLTSVSTGLSSLIFVLTLVHLGLWKTRASKVLGIEKIKLPQTIITLIIVVFIGLIGVLALNPSLISEKVLGLYETLIKPVTGRWNTTVAENRQPYFDEWISSFGKTLFWLFFIGSVLLFKNMLNKLGKKEVWILTGLYTLFFLGLVFSRYAPHPALLDGEGFISRIFYFGSALLFIGGFIYYYLKNYRENSTSFETIDFEYLFIFALLILTLFTARSAVRLIMVLVPIAPIFFAYLLTESLFSINRCKEQTIKIILIALVLALIFFGGYKAVDFYNQTKTQAYYFIPNYYTTQWQNAMSWVRESTPENAIFNHWWDYGYWVQSIGNRATVTDGGNINVWWNYLTGRFVLTGDNQQDSLNFLWNHNVSYLLIDPTDIGKYGAFSQIGSDKDYDRLSQGPLTFLSDERNILETKEGVQRIYSINSGGYGLDEDIIYYNNGTQKELFKERSGIMGISVEYIQQEEQITFDQPKGIFIYNNQRIDIPLRYLYFNGEFYDFNNGIEATAYVIQRVKNVNNGFNIDNFGAVIYLSPRVMRGFLGQVYILNDPLKNFPNFHIAHIENDIFTNNFNSQNANLRDFVYYDNYAGLQGPIKIWQVEYSGKEKVNEEYLANDPPDYITWKF